jgi:RHS repeat-associated protein
LLIGLAVLCGVVRPATGETVRYYHLDAVGNVRALTNQAGVVVERHEFLPYGEEWCPGPPPGLCGSTPPGQPRRFTGKERDNETGLDYFGARYYGSRIGRFTTVDPVYTWQANLENPQRWNRYAYGLNNPLRNVDPDGRVPIPVIVAGIWAAYEIGSQLYDAYTLGTTLVDPNATAGEKAAAGGGFVIGAIAPGGGYGTAGKKAIGMSDDVARALKRGRESEARVLDALGEAKNTGRVKGCEGCSIPDYQNATTIGDIKDAKRVTDSPQLRIQREAAAKSNREHVVQTGTNTRVSKTVQEQSTVRRRDDLGPK